MVATFGGLYRCKGMGERVRETLEQLPRERRGHEGKGWDRMSEQRACERGGLRGQVREGRERGCTTEP